MAPSGTAAKLIYFQRIPIHYENMAIEELDHYISNYILRKNPLHHDIDGAPFRIGQQGKQGQGCVIAIL